MSRRTRTAALAAAVAATTLLVACTGGDEPEPSPTATSAQTPTPTPTPSPTPTPEAAGTRLPAEPTTVLAAADAASRAVEMTRAVYDDAPVAVVAPADDTAAQLRAASLAVALGAPMLLDPTADATPSAVEDEVERLAVQAVLTVGAVTLDVDVEQVAAPEDDAGLTDVVDAELVPTAVPAGTEISHVASLVREEPALLTSDLPVATDEAASAEPAEPAEPGGGAGSRVGGAGGRGTSPRDVLPLTELPAPLADGVVLTTGDAADLAAVATARAAGLDVVGVPGGDPRATSRSVRALAAQQATSVIGLGPGFGAADDLAWRVATAATGVELPGGGQVLFPGRRMVALYGTPSFSGLGLLGEQGVGESIARAQALAAEYQPLTGDVVVPAFEIIVTVASAGAGSDGNYSNELPVESFVPWVEAARDAGVYVVIDLQPGRTDFLTQAQQYEALLRYPNVGLALDPEWRLEPDQVHLRQIGSVHAAEVNAVATWLADLTRANALPQKLLVLHQFKLSMIQARETVDTSRPELAVLIHADGQGGQPAKAGTWRALHAGAPAGVRWGWKNFVDEDSPMLDPASTYAITPVPEFVSYQ